MKYATKGQIQKIHVLLKNLDLMDGKIELVHNFTDGRTTSSSKMYIDEARRLITRLAEHDPSERIKSLIFSLGYQAGMLYGTSPDDKKINAVKLNMFLKERGAVKKDLNSMEYNELIKVHRQFEGIARNTKKTANNKQANNAVKTLLTELNLNTL